MLTPCRLADGWAAFESAAFATLGLDTRTHALHELWLCSRDGVSEALVSRNALHALRDLDHVRVTVVLREAAAELATDATLAHAAPLAAAKAPPATPATAALAPPAALAARFAAALPQEAPAAAHEPPAVAAAATPVQRATPAAAPAHAGGEKRLAEGGGAASAIVKRPRTAAQPRHAAAGGAPAPFALVPARPEHITNPFRPGTFKHAVFAALERTSNKSIPLRNLMEATQDLEFKRAKARTQAHAFGLSTA